jgi:hypothetical protein
MSNTNSASTHQNYCPRITFMLYSLHEKNERSAHDGRRASPILKSQGMEPSQEKEQRERVSLCQEMEALRCLSGSRLKGRGNYRGSSLGETSQGPLKKIKPAHCWQTTIKDSAAFRSSPDAWTVEGNDPRYSLATFSIAACHRASQWLYKRVVCVESVFRPMKGDPKYKVIETKYDNYLFRSRTEARFAVLLNTLGIPYEYEKEGYDLDGEWYLPDFWLPTLDCWVEIKGQEPTEKECSKACNLALATQRDAFILWGDFLPHKVKIYAFITYKDRNAVWFDKSVPYRIGECSKCHEIGIWAHGESNSWGTWICRCRKATDNTNTSRLQAAYAAARQARF